jgi:hypothetical protein
VGSDDTLQPLPRVERARPHQRWLVIAEEAFLPADSGARTETLAFLQACGSHGIACRVWVPGSGERWRYQQALPAFTLDFLPRRSTWSVHLSLRPYVIASRPFPKSVSSRLLDDLARWEPTAVISSTFRVSHIGLETARAVGVPLLVRPHNIESEYFRSLAMSSSGVPRLAYQVEAVKLRRFERHMHDMPDIVAFADLSEEEANNRRRLSVRPVYHLPPFLPTGSSLPPAAGSHASDVMFLGSLDNANNVDGLRWFVDNVWAVILTEFPESRLRVVGRRPSAAVKRLLAATPNVVPMMDLPDVSEAFAETAVFINPVRRGAGVNIKVVEAAARGVAMVSTGVGLRGLGLVPDVDALVADEPPKFADDVRSLLGDSQLRGRIGSSARERVTTTLGHQGLIDRMTAMLTGDRPEQPGASLTRVAVSDTEGSALSSMEDTSPAVGGRRWG